MQVLLLSEDNVCWFDRRRQMRYYDWWMYIVLAVPGILMFLVNWMIFFHNTSQKKFVSGIPPAGGAWIAIVCLISPCRWLALIGFADPGLWLFVVAVITELLQSKKEK